MVRHCSVPFKKFVADEAIRVSSSDLLIQRVAVQRCVGATSALEMVNNTTGSLVVCFAEGARDSFLIG